MPGRYHRFGSTNPGKPKMNPFVDGKATSVDKVQQYPPFHRHLNSFGANNNSYG